MTEQDFIAAEQAKRDANLVGLLKQVKRTGRLAWSAAEALIAHGLIGGAMQNYALTRNGLAKLCSLDASAAMDFRDGLEDAASGAPQLI